VANKAHHVYNDIDKHSMQLDFVNSQTHNSVLITRQTKGQTSAEITKYTKPVPTGISYGN
jgi:hypothetical protein